MNAPQRTWTHGDPSSCDGIETLTLHYFGTDAQDVRDELQSVCGSMIEAPSDMDGAYVMIDASELDAATVELAESGFELVDEDDVPGATVWPSPNYVAPPLVIDNDSRWWT